MITLYIRKSSDAFARHETYSTYRDAVVAGNTIAGPGNFYVDTGNRVPSREEQLLTYNPKQTTRQKKLDAL